MITHLLTGHIVGEDYQPALRGLPVALTNRGIRVKHGPRPRGNCGAYALDRHIKAHLTSQRGSLNTDETSLAFLLDKTHGKHHPMTEHGYEYVVFLDLFEGEELYQIPKPPMPTALREAGFYDGPVHETHTDTVWDVPYKRLGATESFLAAGFDSPHHDDDGCGQSPVEGYPYEILLMIPGVGCAETWHILPGQALPDFEAEIKARGYDLNGDI